MMSQRNVVDRSASCSERQNPKTGFSGCGKNRFCTLVALLFVLSCVFLFSGQQRSGQQRHTSSPPKPPAPPAAKPLPPPPSPSPHRNSLTPPLPEQSDENTEPDIPFIALAPEDIPWPPARQEGAPRNVTLLGDPRLPNLYVTRTMVPKGKQIVPHVHSDSRTVVVLSGTYYYGIGDAFDAKKLLPFPAGSFLTEPAGIPHFTWAKDGDVVVQTTAIGPSGTRVLPDRKESANGR